MKKKNRSLFYVNVLFYSSFKLCLLFKKIYKNYYTPILSSAQNTYIENDDFKVIEYVYILNACKKVFKTKVLLI